MNIFLDYDTVCQDRLFIKRVFQLTLQIEFLEKKRKAV
jgi:hypothetical protein